MGWTGRARPTSPTSSREFCRLREDPSSAPRWTASPIPPPFATGRGAPLPGESSAAPPPAARVGGGGRVASPGDILVFDGIFLHRPELRAYWDYSVFLEVAFAVSIPRGAQRDDSSPDPEAASNQR